MCDTGVTTLLAFANFASCSNGDVWPSSFARFNLGAVVLEHCSRFHRQGDAQAANKRVTEQDLGRSVEESHDGAVRHHVGLGNPGSLPYD